MGLGSVLGYLMILMSHALITDWGMEGEYQISEYIIHLLPILDKITNVVGSSNISN